MTAEPDGPRFPDPARSRVVLIGTGEYERGLDALPGVRNNLTDLVAVLTNPETGVFAPEHTKVVDNPESGKGFMRRLERAADEAEDVLLVYYAGHGLLGGPDDALHLAVYSTEPDHPEYTAVPFAQVSRVIRNSPARTRILVLDCCFSGRAIGAMSGPQAAVRQVDVDGAYTLTATGANHLAKAPPGERNTAFTGALIALLTTGTHDSTPLTLGTLYRPLRAELARRGLPAPQCRQDNASAALALRRDPPPPEPEPEPEAEPEPEPLRMAQSEAGSDLGITVPARFAPMPVAPPRPRPHRSAGVWLRPLGLGTLAVMVILATAFLALFLIFDIVAMIADNPPGPLWPGVLICGMCFVLLGPCVVFLAEGTRRLLAAVRD